MFVYFPWQKNMYIKFSKQYKSSTNQLAISICEKFMIQYILDTKQYFQQIQKCSCIFSFMYDYYDYRAAIYSKVLYLFHKVKCSTWKRHKTWVSWKYMQIWNWWAVQRNIILLWWWRRCVVVRWNLKFQQTLLVTSLYDTRPTHSNEPVRIQS